MPRHAIPSTIRWSTAALAAVLLAALLWHHRAPRQPLTLPAAPMQHEPALMLWAWETPENLLTLDPQRAGVAFLSRELILTDHVTLRPRRQPLLVAPQTFVMAVVRIEATPSFRASPALQHDAAAAILAALDAPNIRALQVDFDATLSQRAFYAAIVRELRPQLPAGFPLSITALTSWCGPASWLHTLPIDEAVPMFFHMGGPAATRASAPRSTASIQEPLCATSLGIATDEAWPAIAAAQRVYLFRPGPWTTADVASINAFHYEHLQGVTPP